MILKQVILEQIILKQDLVRFFHPSGNQIRELVCRKNRFKKSVPEKFNFPGLIQINPSLSVSTTGGSDADTSFRFPKNQMNDTDSLPCQTTETESEKNPVERSVHEICPKMGHGRTSNRTWKNE